MNKQPLVSIIIPTYNRAHLIGETLDCVLAQTYTNWECIVVDDGSADNTNEVVGGYIDKDARFQYHHRPANRLKGANACRNYGFEISKGEYIQWLDSDDIILQNKIFEQIKETKYHDNMILTCKWGSFTNFDDKKLFLNLESYKDFNSTSGFLKSLIISHGYFPIHAYLMPRKLIKISQGWDEKILINQDGEFMSRVFLMVSKFKFVEKTAVFYRVKQENATSNYNINKANEAIKSWKIISKRLSVYSVEYIESMKSRLYKKLKTNFSGLIFKNIYFFKKQILENIKFNLKRLLCKLWFQ